jgi:hypothetical protein
LTLALDSIRTPMTFRASTLPQEAYVLDIRGLLLVTIGRSHSNRTGRCSVVLHLHELSVCLIHDIDKQTLRMRDKHPACFSPFLATLQRSDQAIFTLRAVLDSLRDVISSLFPVVVCWLSRFTKFQARRIFEPQRTHLFLSSFCFVQPYPSPLKLPAI